MSNTPPVPKGASVLTTLLHDTYDRVSREMNLAPAEVLVAFGAVTIVMVMDVAKATGKTREQVLEDYKNSLRLPPTT